MNLNINWSLLDWWIYRWGDWFSESLENAVNQNRSM